MDIVRAEAEFDPEFTAEISGGQDVSPAFSSGGGGTVLNTQRDDTIGLETGLTKKFLTGATGSVFLNTGRSQTNLSGAVPNPSWSSDLTFALTQPLLKDFGRKVNEAEIIIARNNNAISLHEFHSRVLEVISEAQEAYWDLVYAYKDLEVKKRSLSLADDFLEKNKKRVEAGVLAPIETLRPQAELAAREEGVIVAQSRIQDLTDELRNILNLNSIPLGQDYTIRPADEAVYEEAEVNLTSSLKEALENRPDYAQAQKELENLDISLAVAKNATLPHLDLAATYNINGLGGSLGNDADMLATADFFDWQVGLQFTVPLGNRRAKSEYLQAQWEKEKAILSLKVLENDIITEVKTAVREVETDLRRIKTNRQARELAEKRLQAEEKRFELGLGRSLDVLEAQKDVTSAESAELEAIIDYNISLVQLAKVKGTLLAQSGVAMRE
jgi:outer membrane protein TolC